MQPAILRGNEHHELGAVAAVAEANCAIALSRGGAHKPYAHKDPNEDAAAFVCGDAGSFVAVADGHSGCEASHAAIERLVECHVAGWTSRGVLAPAGGWAGSLLAAVIDIHHAIVRNAIGTTATASRTTLALALVRPEEDLLVFASAGDSHVFRASGGHADDLAAATASRKLWLGAPGESPESLRSWCVSGERGLAGTRAILLATDGISEPGIGFADPARGVSDAVEHGSRATPALRALVTGRTLVERALAAHQNHRAGDNVAAAVVWIAD